MQAGRITTTLSVCVLLAGAPRMVTAQAANGPRALEGGWVRLDTAGSGSWDGLTASFPRAVLTSEGTARFKPEVDPDDVDPDNRPHKAGEPYIVSLGQCGVGGAAANIEPNSAAFFLIPTRDEVLIVREGPGARHIYTDGREHPPLSRISPNNAGHSTGTWDGNDLVVETIGLAENNVVAGGWRTPQTRVTERYHVAGDGMRMRITYTWTDPVIYARPHSYSLDFERLPADSYAFENWCDSGDPLQRQSVVPPEQVK